MKYAPISFKSDYSLMMSLLKVNDVITYSENLGCSYAGLLDENPYGLMDFYDKCEKNNLKCVFGMIVKIGDNKIYLYIKNYEGYLNIIKINDLVHEGKLAIEELIKCNAGLICVLPYENYNMYNRLKVAFSVYLGYKNDIELENAYKISRNVLFLNEIMYLKKEDANLLKILYKIAGSNYENGDNYVLPMSEFDRNTIKEFVDLIDLKFDFSKRYIPKFCKTEEESTNLLYSLARKGLEKRLNGNVPEKYSKRLKYELDVITKMGFVDYFLIVFDYVKFAKKNDIYVGPGRGSAAGALVSYALGIIEIDPMKYDLLFERFLNPERITMPDIDIDFEDVERGRVIDYVRNKYGERKVALIIAYGTFKSRQVIRDVGKVFNIEEKQIDSLSKMLDAQKSLKDNLDNAEVVDFVKANNLAKVYKISMRLEGLKKHTTIHAAGVIICSEPLKTIVPTFKTGDGILTGYTVEYLEKLGLLKMDFLAVRDLNILHRTVDIVRKKYPNFSLKDIPLDDVATYKLLSSGNTDNIFQFKTPGMKKFVKKLEPQNFDDITAAVALFRPGPMDNIDEYIARRKGLKKVTYIHPDLVPILSSTYGIIIYQEQIMQILVLMGGYSYAEADLIRRAMSKKKKEVMINERVKFIERSTSKGYTKEVAEAVYDLIVKFANYGFNKSHSVAYALIGYQMAYLKANYVELFHVSTLNMNLGSDAKIKDVIDDAKNKGMKIIKPSINKSGYQYVMEDRTIILPLTSIKNISSMQSKVVVDNQPYSDYFDFIKKVYGKGLTRNNIEDLIKAGALDEFGFSKNTLLSNIDAAITYIELIGSLDESLVMKPEMEVSSEPDVEYSEIDVFGFYVSGHPASKIEDKNIVKIKYINNYIGRFIEVAVLVDKVKVINTKKGEAMAFINVNDDTGSIGGVIFPKQNNLIDLIDKEGINRLRVQVSKRSDEVQLVVDSIKNEKKEK